jgi:hypothetical protein
LVRSDASAENVDSLFEQGFASAPRLDADRLPKRVLLGHWDRVEVGAPTKGLRKRNPGRGIKARVGATQRFGPNVRAFF